MGFLDSLGEFLGDMVGGLAAQAQEAVKYKQEYESLSDKDLVREYNRIKDRSGQEFKSRVMAIRSIARDRGLIS